MNGRGIPERDARFFVPSSYRAIKQALFHAIDESLPFIANRRASSSLPVAAEPMAHPMITEIGRDHEGKTSRRPPVAA